MSTAPLPLAVQGEDSLRVEHSGPSNELINFPPSATLKRCASVQDGMHVSEVVTGDGIHVIATFQDLVEYRVAMQALTGRIASTKVHVHVLTGEPASFGESFRSYLTYAKKVGGAKNVLSPSHDLARLLDVHTDGRHDFRNLLRNGLLLVVDGVIVWKRVASPTRRDELSHDLDGLKAAIAHYSK